MSTTIWKYDLGSNIISEHDTPAGAKFLHAGIDPDGHLCVWMRVDDEFSDMEKHTFAVLKTGEPVPDDWNHKATLRVSQLMLHVHHYNKVEPIVVDTEIEEI